MRVGLMFARLFLMKRDLDRADTHLAEGLEAGRGYRVPASPGPGISDPRRDLGSGRASGEARAKLRRALEVAEATAAPRTIWETAGALGRALGPAAGG